ncbi:MAG: alanine--glyoxylate aminotransferase family protein [Candidatus Diapherotrites archaeon]|nr:alanine--glyoxylate aminotransferase family protein [Candidatus Diapherotrites archaeon]
MHKILYIPGPVEVRKDVLEKMSTPLVGHRTKEFAELFHDVKGKLKQLFYTENPVMVSTSSGSGFMEAAMRNLVGKKVLNCVCGSFSDKWYNIAIRCGKEAEKLEVDWGKAIKPDMIEEKLSTGEFDAICVTHNETSTGVMHHLEEISEVVKNYPDVMFLVDAVSSLGGAKIEVDKLGIDMCITSSQKALALPPGIALASVSEKALERAKQIPGRGYYFDLLELKKMYDKDNTPYTPSVSHLYALKYQLDRMLEEGLENRFKRHERLAEKTRKWGKKLGFELFPETGYESVTVSCFSDTKGMDLSKMKELMGERGFSVDSGYRKLNNKLADAGKPMTFRIAHMGDTTEEDLDTLFGAYEEVFPKVGGA